MNYWWLCKRPLASVRTKHRSLSPVFRPLFIRKDHSRIKWINGCSWWILVSFSSLFRFYCSYFSRNRSQLFSAYSPDSVGSEELVGVGRNKGIMRISSGLKFIRWPEIQYSNELCCCSMAARSIKLQLFPNMKTVTTRLGDTMSDSSLDNKINKLSFYCKTI